MSFREKGIKKAWNPGDSMPFQGEFVGKGLRAAVEGRGKV